MDNMRQNDYRKPWDPENINSINEFTIETDMKLKGILCYTDRMSYGIDCNWCYAIIMNMRIWINLCVLLSKMTINLQIIYLN